MKRNALIRIILFAILIPILAFPLVNLIDDRDDRRQITVTQHAVPVSTDPITGETLPAATSDLFFGTRVFPAEDIHSLDIDWAAGSVSIVPCEDEFIYIYESGDPTNPMDCKIKEGELSIDFSDEDLHLIRFDKDKDLRIEVPKDWFCRSLEVDAASATLQIHDLTFGEIDIDTASGEVRLTNCTANSLDVDTASGSVRYEGEINRISCDAASADLTAILRNTPNSIEMDSASGHLELTLPRDTGFTLSLNGISTVTSSEFSLTSQDDKYICGDGRCRISLNSMSGKVFLRELK